MLKAVGARGSANWHHVALMNWARLARVDIGRKGYVGFAFFVEPGIRYVIEHRGPGFPPFRHEWLSEFDEKTFNGGVVSRWFWRSKRSQSFRHALAVYRRLQDGK